ncbi:uncharacterized protein IL334_002384 [Kwoniella shivajii]|uniref:Transcription initiation factor TFIID subunit 4 n=1 Tax=Kwoniella shivajii TaxID=564305 RepID=A0ABZ1CUL6_9TREE|nr:hypothetical protein IL334_002384 [Kwoniella shivajii]
MQKTKGDTFDLRAEEDAARRLNVGKAVTSNSSYAGLKSRAKKTDLIGKSALKEKVEAIAKDHGVTFDNEVSLYLLSSIENRIRSLLSSALQAQQHRTQSSHLRTPPIYSSSSSSSGPSRMTTSMNEGRSMWSHLVNSDPNSVMDAVNKSYREEEQEFRKFRMTRLAKEAELQKIKERQSSLGPGSDSYINGGMGMGMGMGIDDQAGPSTPISKPSSSSINTPIGGGGGGGGGGTPMFGAIKESNSSSTKKSIKKSLNPRDVSAEVQHKMANATAMRSVGMGKKYGWMTGNVPTISSPLANNSGSSSSKKRKAEKDSNKQSKLKESSLFGSGSDTNKADKDKSIEPSTPNAVGSGSTPESEREKDRPTKKHKPTITNPTRRLILTDKDDKSTGTGEKRVQDDKCLTLVDLVFALEHRGLGGNGVGKEDDILRKIWAGKGGPWGEDGWDGRK